MSSFTKHSNIAPHWEQWKNTKSFRFYHDDSKTWICDEVPEWFIFDGCSIPLCIFWQKIEPATLTACCYHDRLFRHKKYWFFYSNYLFLLAMRVDNVRISKRIKYYIWVNLFWWITRNYEIIKKCLQ